MAMTDQADFEAANQYALERLKKEMARNRVYHSPMHTEREVVPSVRRLATMEGVSGERTLLETAAYFHDLGSWRPGHEELYPHCA
jgi:HD superfamily phosphodiesterase